MIGSLYFHVPFCTKRCPYCHFAISLSKEHQYYLEALRREWHLRSPLLKDHEIASIYFGGGTPSLLSPEAFTDVLSYLPPAEEITLEGNPENLTFDKLKALRETGINRLSIGVQSLNDSELKMLGRTHNAAKAKEILHAAHRAGFDNISIDLMYELPGQTPSSWKNTLMQLKDLPITHLSLYNLTIEPNTAYFRRQKELAPLIPPSDMAKEMLDEAVFYFASLGLERYEISAFAKPGYESKHNIGYWTARPFVGLGPSAFSYIDGRRFRNVCSLPRYLKLADPTDFSEKLPYPNNINELLAVELRLVKGAKLSPHLPASTRSTLERLRKEGYLKIESAIAKLTEKGRLFYDSVATEII